MRLRIRRSVIMKVMSRDKWKCALIGAGICGIVGPAISVILLNVFFIRPPSIRVASRMIFEEWAVASLGFGPPALLLGGIGAVILQNLIRQGRSIKVALLQTAALGLILGSAVPVMTNAVFAVPAPQEYNLKNDVLFELPLAAITGVVCELLVLWMLRLTNLLRQPNPPARV